MSLKSWFKRATTIPKTGKGILGNLIKNVSPLAAFTPLGVVGSGLLGTAGGLVRGEKVGKALGSGLSNAALGAGASALGAKVGLGSGPHLGLGLGEPSASAANASRLNSLSPEIPTGSVVQNGGALGAPGGVSSAVTTPDPIGAGSRLGAGVSRVAKFAEAHPNATGMALQGIGNIAGSDSENRLRNAQARRLEQQIGESDYDFRRRQANETEYDKLWNPLGTAIGTGLNGGGVSRNPYLPA